jgi:peptidoglycan/LPS O-acetylase OafA/YrhL
MAAFWFVFGMITIFSPGLMNMFQTEAGINAVTTYSNHIWQHDGFDIVSVCVLFFALSRERVSRNLIRASAIVALFVVIAITSSLLGSPYWNMLFVVPGVCCLGFAIWGFRLAGKAE